MPNLKEDHLRLANYLYETAQRYEEDSLLPYTWEIVNLFYSALHLADAYFCYKANGSPQNHKARQKLMSMHKDLADCWDRYNALYTAGHNARYKPKYQPNSEALNTVRSNYQYLRKRLLEILEGP